MNDLEMIRTLLAKPGPSRDVVDRGRRQLQEAMRGPVRRRRIGWLATGLGLTGAAAAAAVVVTSGATAPTPTTNSPPAAQSGQQILLAAARTAERTPEGSGTYWYVKTLLADGEGKSDRWETWTRRDGQTWFRGAKTHGRVVKQLRLSQPGRFRLVVAELSFGQLQTLPTDPAALKAWIVKAIEHGKGSERVSKSHVREAIFDALTSLVSQLPAPPKVRAAAFRAMASLPSVRSLGAVRGGQGLLISLAGNQQARLVVEPATSRVHDTNFFVTSDGAEVWLRTPGSATVIAEWTNRLPR